MAIAITIPRLGWNMEEGIFAGWLKQHGEVIRAGEPLFSLEGDKATQDVESIDPGILSIPSTAPSVGAKVVVGAIIGYLVDAGDILEHNLPTAAKIQEKVDPAREAPRTTQSSERGHRILSTPLARRIARDLGIDWTRLAGSGNGGRIRKADVLQAAKTGAPSPSARSVPISPARRAIAARMVASGQTAAPVTLHTTLDATNLVNLRRQFKEAGPLARLVPSITEIFVKLTALTLREHPMLNSRWSDDRIEISEAVHIGTAVDTEVGLLVPVLRDVGGLALGQIAERSRAAIERIRERRISLEDISGGTFTITNLGAFGIESFTPIINPPECAILGLGRIALQPVMVGDHVVARDRMALSLTFDHRIVDGAPAARFLQDLVAKVENPSPWLIA